MKTLETVVLLLCDAILIEAVPCRTRMEIIHLILIWVRIRIRPKLKVLADCFQVKYYVRKLCFLKPGFHMIPMIAAIAELFFSSFFYLSDCSDHSDRSDHMETGLYFDLLAYRLKKRLKKNWKNTNVRWKNDRREIKVWKAKNDREDRKS